MSPVIQEKARQIKLLLLDVDGVLTDGRLYYSNSGEELKAFNTLDGHGIKLLQRTGVNVGIITGRTSNLVAKRANELGVSYLIQGREDKWVALQEILGNSNLQLNEIAFMGDDWPDLSIMTRVGLALTVQNAHFTVRERAHWQSQYRGGEGAVREACDLLMQAQNTFTAALAHYLPETHS